MRFTPSDIRGVRIARHTPGTRIAPLDGAGRNGRALQHWRENRTLAPRGSVSPLVVSLDDAGERVVRCVEGGVVAIVVDCRVDSDSFGDSQSFPMPANVARSLVVPAGVAVGWQVTEEYAEVGTSAWDGEAEEFVLDDCSANCEWPLAQSQYLEADLDIVDLEYIESLTAKSTFEQTGCESSDHSTIDAETAAWPANDQPGTEVEDKEIRPRLSIASPPRPRRAQNAEPTILVIGSTGQLGHDLVRRLRGTGRVIGACRKPRDDGHLPIATTVDISRPASIREAIRRTRPQLIVNAAALTDVAACEESPRRAQGINANAPAIMAEEARKIGAGLVHFCSDKVFGGDGDRPHKETDAATPVNQYGRTKLRGTQAVVGSGVEHLVLRTGWLYSTHGANYIQNIVDQITYRASLKIATDYFGTPTSTDWLAKTVAGLLNQANGDIRGWLQDHGGIYHAAALGYASRLDVADHVVATCRQHALPVVLHKLTGVSLDTLTNSVRCPKNCRLDVSQLATKFQIALPSWREQLAQQLAIILGVGEGRLLSIA
ncbi:MAG: hypothetical protein Aurels2KO_31220 [Aureliella sp.]